MSSDVDYSLDIQALSSRLNDGSLEPLTHLEAVYDRIEQYADKSVWIKLFNRQNAIEQLAAAQERKQRGIRQPLFGIPFAVKDNIDVAGQPTTAACPAFAYTAAQNATAVTRLCGAGAILIGKTNLDQF